MKRYWPLILALFCWLLVLVVPTTRHGVWAGWDNWNSHNDGGYHWVSFYARKNSPVYPSHEKRGEIYTAIERDDIEHYDDLARRYPNDALVAALQLYRAAVKLKFSRGNGPVSSVSYPILQAMEDDSPRAEWDKMMAIARRGQSIEPQNCFFDGFLIYGLYATRQDDEARRVLKTAAQKTIYDSHERDAILNTAQVLNAVYNRPAPPLQLETLAKDTKSISSFHLRDITNWTMDTAIYDRIAGRHQRALDAVADLVKFGRTIRVNSLSVDDSKLGFECEETALLETDLPDNKNNRRPYQIDADGPIPLARYQLYSRSLYLYAKRQKRNDIAKLASTQWSEMYGSLKMYAYHENHRDDLAPDVAQVVNTNRLQSLLLKSLLATGILGAIFGSLSWRFGPPVQAKPQFWRGAIAAFVVPAIVWGGLYYLLPLEDIIEEFHYEVDSLNDFGTWILIAVPAIVCCLGLQQAGRWQREQKNGAIRFKTRLKNLTAPTEDGLTRFDFGWIVGQILNISYWLLVVALFIVINWRTQVVYGLFDTTMLKLHLITLAVVILPFLVTRTVSWCLLPRRGETVRLSFRYISQMASGYLVAASVFYAVLAFVTLGVTFNYTQKFETKTQMGDLKTTRAAMGH